MLPSEGWRDIRNMFYYYFNLTPMLLIRSLHRFIMALISLLITLIVVVSLLYIYMYAKLPDVQMLKDVHMQMPLRIYSRDGQLISEFGDKRRVPVALNQVPQQLINAVLATEDQRFYSHPGVDMKSMLRAVKAVISTGRKAQGASTITMQVARNFFLSNKKTYTRKIKEILLALKIERTFSKNKILELYLNQVYFGSHAYGVASASQVYYGKSLQHLSLGQMAMVAGLPQAPSRNNPLRDVEAAKERRNHVLERMLEMNFITPQQYHQAIAEPMDAVYHGPKVVLHAPYIAEMVRQTMLKEYGDSIYERGLSVYTTVSVKLQTAANKALQMGLIDYSERHGYHKTTLNLSRTKLGDWRTELDKLKLDSEILYPAAVLKINNQSAQALFADGEIIDIPWEGLSWVHTKYGAPRKVGDVLKYGDVIWVRQTDDGAWRLSELPQAQGALVSLNPKNGAILALVGGFDYGANQFNRAVQAERQVGSNIKPFIYSAAFDKGYNLASIINDAPIVIKQPDNTWWRPQNDEKIFYGPTRLRIGLAESRNLVSIRLLQSIGISYAINYMHRFGFDADQLPHGLSLALGTADLTPLNVAAGYTVFANGGFYVTPHFIQRIVDQDNHVVFKARPAEACAACITDEDHPANSRKPLAPQVITPQNAYLMNQALQGVIQSGTGRGAQVLNRQDLAGKTGTTDDLRDAWFSGFNGRIETTVWVGFDDLQNSLHEHGAQASLPIWINYMRAALQDMPEQSMAEPPGIVRARIDPHTGLLAYPGQPDALFEVFQEGDEPTKHGRMDAPALDPFTNDSDGGGGSSHAGGHELF